MGRSDFQNPFQRSTPSVLSMSLIGVLERPLDWTKIAARVAQVLRAKQERAWHSKLD
jgi:hypothetical protein